MQKEGTGKIGCAGFTPGRGKLAATAKAAKAAATKAFRAARGAAGARRRAHAAESTAAKAARSAAAASDGDDDEPVLATPPRAANRPRAAAGMGSSGEDDRAAPVPRARAAPVLGAGAAMESSDEDAAAGVPPFIARVRPGCLRLVCREIQAAAAAHSSDDRETVILGSIGGLRACFPRVRCANACTSVVDAYFVHFVGLLELSKLCCHGRCAYVPAGHPCAGHELL